MKQANDHNLLQRSLPLDIAFRIVSSLEVEDVCALGSCSQFWRELCRSDQIWESLTRTRWPSLFDNPPSNSTSFPSPNPNNNTRWREFYIETHKDRVEKTTAAVKFVEQRCCLSGSLEFGDYKLATKYLVSWQFSFRDVQMLLFKPNLNVLLNMVALHYCIFDLLLPAGDIVDALVSCEIADRVVSIKWWKLGRWFYGFRLKDESHCRSVALADVAGVDGAEVLGVLRGGVLNQVLRVQIAAPITSPLCHLVKDCGPLNNTTRVRMLVSANAACTY